MKRQIFATILALSILIPQTHAQTVFVSGGFLKAYEVNPVLLASEKVTAAAAAKETTQTIFEWAQSFVLSELKKQILDMLVDQIVSWAQGGGDPKFIADWGSFLADVGNQVAGDFVQELGLGFLCAPISAQIQVAVGSPRSFAQRAQCTLDQIVGNIQSFYDNFINGGWIAYQESWQPQNNYFGSLLMAIQERDNRMERAQLAAQNEGIAGGGFLSTKDESGRITTPGSVVGSLVSKAVGSDIDYIINAEQLQDYIGAIANALINRLIKEGVGGLQGIGAPKAPRGGSISSTEGGPCAGLTGATLDSCLRYSSSSNNSFTAAKANIIAQINQTLVPRVDARNIINSSIDALQKYTDELNKIYTDLFLLQKKISFESECQKSKSELQLELLDEINKEEIALNRLRQDQNNNQTIIASLELTKNQIETIPQNDWASLTVAIDNAQDKLNALEAENFKSAAQDENADIKTRTAEKLASFKNQISTCYQ